MSSFSVRELFIQGWVSFIGEFTDSLIIFIQQINYSPCSGNINRYYSLRIEPVKTKSYYHQMILEGGNYFVTITSSACTTPSCQ
mmetsp:Transcript_15534/g.32678  ORF Transcript_15534/g.32678 Transcript_15534/m.32678 type:complete len:84 (+) Transcript_15534:873-1124(+)